MKIRIKLGNDKIYQTVGKATSDYFLQMSEEELTTDIKKETPVDYGKLRGSWTPKRSNTRITVENSRNYAVFVEKGTGMFSETGKHFIEASGSAFHAIIGGEEVFFTRHKGMEGRHMAEKGTKAFKKKIPSLFNIAVKKTAGGK